MGSYLRTHFGPRPWPVPFDKILRGWLAADLEPARCRKVIEAALNDGMPDGLLDPSQLESGGIVATDRLLYIDRAKEPWIWSITTPQGTHTFEVPREFAPTLAELVRIAAHAPTKDDAISHVREYLDDEDLVLLVGQAIAATSEFGTWAPTDCAGVHRREHASLSIRTEAGALLVMDPQRLANNWTTNFGAFPTEPKFDQGRVLITHSHDDHFDMASIASHTSSEQNVIVPWVPNPSLLADDMNLLLALCDQSVISPRWWDRIPIEDVIVHVLPFYGEQPAKRWALPQGVRNWGNCYRFDFSNWSLAVVADSGEDTAGSCVEMLRRSVDQHGPIDVLMSCCSSFPEMINLGLPHYAFVLPFEALRGGVKTRGSMTNGASGIAAACEAAGVRYLLPYAHGFRALYAEPTSAESSLSETELLVDVRRELAVRGCSTEILQWHPGDALVWRDRKPTIYRAR